MTPTPRRPLTRGRGLKQTGTGVLASRRASPPYTGAWIETIVTAERGLRAPSPPYTGAWIETRRQRRHRSRRRVAPLHGGVD